MRKTRKSVPLPEMWGVEEIMSYLNCDKMKAKRIFEDYHKEYGGGYAPVEKHIMIDYIQRLEREENDRQRHNDAWDATVKMSVSLEEQVKALREQSLTLKEQSQALKEEVLILHKQQAKNSREALCASIRAWVAIVISFCMLIAQLIH